MNSRTGLVTALGWVTLAGAVLGCTLGWWLGWVEFLAFGVGCLLALVVAVAFVVGGTELEVERRLDPDRVSVGEPARSILRITNTGRGRSAARVIVDEVGSRRHLIDVEPLPSGGWVERPVPLPTQHRAVVQVGPAEISKGDPLGLLRRTLGRSAVAKFYVHPRVVPLASPHSGFVKDLEGPTYDTSPAGDVSFHTIREYQPGDDIRHIHWMSTARTGDLMIRHHVDNRRPYLGVLVDSRTSSLAPEHFERVLEVAASHVVSAALESRPIAVWVGEQQIVTADTPADKNAALDRFCSSSQVDTDLDLIGFQDRARRTDPGISALLVLTGQLDPADLLPLAVAASRHVGVVIGRCGPPGSAVDVPRAHVIDFADAESFAHQWRGFAS